MALTDTGIRLVKHTGAPAGDKLRDGGGMYLLVTATAKCWRMNYRFKNARIGNLPSGIVSSSKNSSR